MWPNPQETIGTLICSMWLLSLEFTLYLYKSIIQPCMEYCSYIWASAPNCYLDMSGKLQKVVCRTVGDSLSAFFEPLAHCRNVASWSIFYRYYLVDVHLNWLNLFHFLILVAGPLLLLIVCIIFLPPFLGVIRMFMSTVSSIAVSFLNFWILFLQNTFLWPNIRMALSLKLTDTYYLWVLSKQASHILSIFFHFFFL